MFLGSNVRTIVVERVEGRREMVSTKLVPRSAGGGSQMSVSNAVSIIVHSLKRPCPKLLQEDEVQTSRQSLLSYLRRKSPAVEVI